MEGLLTQQGLQKRDRRPCQSGRQSIYENTQIIRHQNKAESNYFGPPIEIVEGTIGPRVQVKEGKRLLSEGFL